MASCNYDAPNGQTSLLYPQLEQALGSDEALRIWMYLRSQEFGDQFLQGWTIDSLVEETKAIGGDDWQETFRGYMEQLGVAHGMQTDPNGEPTMEWLRQNVPMRERGQEPTAPVTTPQPGRPTRYTDTDLFGAAANKDARKSNEDVLRAIRGVYDQAVANPNQQIDLRSFGVKGINKPGASGFSPLELANLFASLNIPANVIFNDDFKALIANTAKSQLGAAEFLEAPMLTYEESAIQDALDELSIPHRDEAGNKTGDNFTSEQTVAAIDTIVRLVQQEVTRNPDILDPTKGVTVGSILAPDRAIYARLRDYIEKYEGRHNLGALTEEEADARAASLRLVLNSWEDFVKRALIRLQSYGLRTKYNPAKVGESIVDTLEFLQEDVRAKGLEDYYDSSFERDPRDTASGRIKLFLASIEDMEVGQEREPQKVRLNFSDPEVRAALGAKGRRKRFSIRTPEQMAALGMQVGKDYITEVDGVKYRVTAHKALTEQDLDKATTITRADGTAESIPADELYHVGMEEGLRPDEEEFLKPGDALLELQRWVPDPNKNQVKVNFLGFPRLVDFETLFQELLEITSGVARTASGTDVYGAMINAISDEAKNFRPSLYAVMRNLEASDQQMKNEFVKVMSKQYQEFQIVLFSKKKSGLMGLRIINANSGSAVTSIIDQWKENQKHSEIVQRDPQGNMKINAELANTLHGDMRTIAAEIAAKRFPDIETVLKPFVRRILEANGIVLTDKAMNYLFSNTVKATNNTSLSGSIFDQFGFTREGVPSGIFSVITAKLAGVTEESDIDDTRYLLNNNPLYTENTAMRILARIAYRNSPRTAAISHRSSDGKTIYDFGMHTHLSSSIQSLLQDSTFQSLMKNTFMGKHNWLMQAITAGTIKDEFGVHYVDGLKDDDRASARGVTRPSMSSREQLLYAMGQFQNGGNMKVANFLSLTHSDKTTTPLFTSVPRFHFNTKGLANNTKDAIYHTFLGEYERVMDWHSKRTLNSDGTYTDPTTEVDAYNKGGGLYYLMPWLNYDALVDRKIPQSDIDQLWRSKGVPNTNLSVADAKKLILRLFETEFLKPEINTLYAKMEKDGFMEQGLIDERYRDRNLGNMGLYKVIIPVEGQQPIVEFHKLQTDPGIAQMGLSKEEVNKLQFAYAAKDFLLNYFLFHTAVTGLVYGDPALAYKPGKRAATDYDKVTDTMKEYQKRLAKDIAPGQDPTWENGSTETYRTITLLDDERLHPYLDNLEKYRGKEINGSDAQEFTTVREHLYVMKSLGTISDQNYREMIAIIDKGLEAEDKYYEFEKPEHKAVVMQIMKPVAVSHNFSQVPGLDSIQYVKSSAMPLYPPLTRQFQIDELRQAMEGEKGKPETHIPRANFISAKKMGAPYVLNASKAGKGVKVFDGNGNINIDTAGQSWRDAQQVLSREGFRIQQEVPYDEVKEAILTGSQENKLITQGIYDIQDFTIPGLEGTFSGDEVKAMKEQVRRNLIDLQYYDFAESIGMREDGVANTERLIEVLTEEAVSRNYPPNDIIMLQRRIERADNAGQTFQDLAIPLFFNPSASKFESMLLSLIKSRIGKVYMPGKSFIQASSAGFKFKASTTFENMTEAQKSGIVWVPKADGSGIDFDGNELRTMTPGSPAQVLMPFNFMVKDANKNDVAASIEDYLKSDEKGRRILDMDKVPRELIEAIGFRIPTQGHNSMLPIQVVGFVPANMGDMIVVPAAITTQMGSDFDVDKLYVYRRPYNHNAKSNTFEAVKGHEITSAKAAADFLSRRLGRDVSSDTDSVVAAQTEAEQNMTDVEATQLRSELTQYVDQQSKPREDQLLRRYFDIQWGILTHKDMYDRVMSPLDKPDLKNEAERVDRAEQLKKKTGPVTKPFYSVTNQLEDFSSQKDAKVMVGISSLSVVFTAVIEDKHLRVEKMVATEDENGDPVINDDGKKASHAEPNGIDFVPEGEQDAVHAHILSGTGRAPYYMWNDNGELKPADADWRMTSEGLQRVLLDPVTGRQVGTMKDAHIEYRSKIDDLTSLQSEFLDHAKNRTIDRLNINLQTIYAAMAMAMLSGGNDAKPQSKHIALFLRQPALIELVGELSKSQDSLSSGGYNPNLLRDTVQSMVDVLVSRATEHDEDLSHRIDQAGGVEQYLKNGSYTTLSIPSLKEGLRGEEDPESLLHQAAMLYTFSHLHAIGRELGNIQKIFNQDPKGPGKNMITVLDTLMSSTGLDGGLIKGARSIFDTETGFIHRTELNTAGLAYKEVLPYAGVTRLIGRIKEIIGRDRLSLEDQQDVVDNFKSYIFSSNELGLSQNPMLDRFRLLYGTNTEQSLASRVWEAKNTWGSNNYFLNRLRPQLAEVPNAPSYVFYQASRASALDDQENTAAFLELLTSSDPDQRRLAEDLVRYAYATGGVSGNLSFIRYISADYLASLPFAAYLRTVNKNMIDYAQLASDEAAFPYTDFVRQWIQHNPSMMPKITLEMLGTAENPRESLSETFSLPVITPELNGPLASLVRSDPNLGKVWPDYLSFFDKEDRMWKLYRRDGSLDYRRIDTLGNSYVYEYHQGVAGDGHVRSIITPNRALINDSFAPSLSQFMTDVKLSSPATDAMNYPMGSGKTLGDLSSLKSYEVTHLQKQLAADESVGTDQRVLTKVLEEVMSAVRDSRPITVKIDRDTNTVNPGMVNPGSATNDGTVTLYVNPQTDHILGNSTGLARVLNHESLHVMMYPFSNSNAAYRSQFPEAAQAYDDLKEVYNEAKAAVVELLKANGLSEQYAQNALKGAKYADKHTDMINLYYRVHNIDEFFTSVLTRSDLQEFLNKTQSKIQDKTLLGRLLGAIMDFVKGLAKSLGINVKDGSILQVALTRSFKFIEENTNPDIKHISNEQIRKLVYDYIVGQDMTKENVVKDIVDRINRDFDGLKVGYELNEKTGAYRITTDEDAFYGRNNFNPDTATTEVTNPIDKVYGKVKDQILDIESSIAKARDKATPDVLRHRQLLRELRQLQADLKATGSLERVAAMAKYQLDWAKTVADQFQNQGLPLTINEIMTAYRLASLWTDIVPLMYGNTESQVSDPALQKVQADAQDLHNRFTSSIMKSALKKIAAKEGRTLTNEDFGDGLQDMATAEAKFESLERAKSKLVQEVALAIQNANRNYLEDAERLVHKLQSFEKKASALASKRGLKTDQLYERMFQKGSHWGLVSEYSSAFYKWKAGLKTRLNNTITKIMEEEKDEQSRFTQIRDAHAKYWRDLKRKAGYVDPRTMFDNTGELKTTSSATKFRDGMVKEYGQEITDRLINEAQKKFKAYLSERERVHTTYDAEVETGYMTAEKAAIAKGQWDLENSPIHKMATQETVLDSKYMSNAEKYMVLVPHIDAKDQFTGESFFDENYGQIQGDREMKELYDETREMLDTLKANLPFYLDDKLGPHFLPAIQKRMMDDMTQVPAYIKSLPQRLMNNLTASSYEEMLQNRTRKEIPIMYTEDPLADIPRPDKSLKGEARDKAWAEYNKAREEKLATYTKDLPRIMEMFGMMSLHYKHFMDAKDSIDLGHEVLKQAHASIEGGMRMIERNGKKITVKGGLPNALGAVEYAIDSLMYKRTKDLEVKAGELHRIKKGEKVEQTVKELRIATEQAHAKLRNNEMTQEEHDKEMQRINKELDKYEIRRFYGSKVADTLITWAQMKALSYNPLSAINNVAFGLISAQIHANGKQDFTNKEFRKAFSIMMNSTGRSLGLSRMLGNDAAISKTSRKVLALMDKLGVMGELTDAQYGKNNVERKKGGWKETAMPMQLMKTGDYFCKGLNTVACLLHEKVKIDGQEVSLWDAFDEDGNFKGKDEKWQSEDVASQTALHAFRNKVIAVNKIIMGNQDKSSPIWAKKSALWRLAGQFRLSWFAEGLASRFESERDDIQLGRSRKGRYRTYADLGFMQSISMLFKQALSAVPGVNMDPFKSVHLTNGKEMSDTDKANMRRNISEIAWFLMLFGSMHAIAMLGSPDDDDAKRKRYKFVYNMITRSYQDVALYSNPTVFDTIIGTPAPALSTIKDAWATIPASIRLMTDNDYTWDKWALKMTKAGFIPQTTLINKFHTMTTKDLNTLSH
jgi:hypothetical protein